MTGDGVVGLYGRCVTKAVTVVNKHVIDFATTLLLPLVVKIVVETELRNEAATLNRVLVREQLATEFNFQISSAHCNKTENSNTLTTHLLFYTY